MNLKAQYAARTMETDRAERIEAKKRLKALDKKNGAKMGKIVTINRPGVFRRAYGKGQSFVSPVLITYVVKSRNRKKRIGIVTSKKIGKATKRNRARRIIKEAYRLIFNKILPGYDFVFVARGKTPFVKMQSVQVEMIKHLSASGAIK